MNEDTPSAFSVAHYVLLFLVSTFCTVAVVWILIAANNREAALNDKFIHNPNTTKACQRQTADTITDIWENRPNDIPKQYILIEKNYANRIVPVRTTGICNGQKFICRMGDIRSTCDPCAKNSAKKRAMFQHISDAIDKACKD